MDWACAQAELDRRQGAAGKHLQGGQSLSALAARRRGFIGDPTRQAGGIYPASLARRADGAPASQGCRHRLGQQDRPHCLGADGQRHTLQRACSAGSLRDARFTRANEVGKGNTRIMHPAGRSGDRDTPLVPWQLLTTAFDRDLISRKALWPAAMRKRRIERPDTGSTDQPCITSKKLLPTGSRPHMAAYRRRAEAARHEAGLSSTRRFRPVVGHALWRGTHSGCRSR